MSYNFTPRYQPGDLVYLCTKDGVCSGIIESEILMPRSISAVYSRYQVLVEHGYCGTESIRWPGLFIWPTEDEAKEQYLVNRKEV